MKFSEIKQGLRLENVVANKVVTVRAIDQVSDQSATLIYQDESGGLGQKIITSEEALNFKVVTTGRWSFNADGEKFRLASEARRISWAHLFDPFAGIESAAIEPLPHQIEAVYNEMLTKQPLRFLLADDPGAGKTIMSGLLMLELRLRGDLTRCLIVAPGSLVEQWQDELYEKFNLNFDLMSRSMVEASRTGNPFIEKNLLIARLDQLSRSEDLQEKLKVADWDLVIVDEAHKMSARRYGRKVVQTQRYRLGQMLRERTRNFLLLTATPHDGKPDDFLLFMQLLDHERFEGQIRDGEEIDTTGVMRRYVKENLLRFDGTRLFPQRFSTTLKFELSKIENDLYDSVSEYVRTGMNQAARMIEAGDRRGAVVGFALTGLQRRLASSPAAIHNSLQRRQRKLLEKVESWTQIVDEGGPITISDLPSGVRLQDIEEFDYDSWTDEDLEELEITIDGETAAATLQELESEAEAVGVLVEKAHAVLQSGEDKKWNELREVLRSEEFHGGDVPKKLIVFTEHKDTLTYISDRIRQELGQPEAVVEIHGGVKREDRRRIQEDFRTNSQVRILVATDAAGEGVNLQRANMVVNYDLPWNPNRIEQRFGRVHRIGQDLPCYLWNLVAHQTREGRVFERLFAKIEQQRNAFGDQVYDILGDAKINASLKELLDRAIRDEDNPVHREYLEEVIDRDIGQHLTDVLEERALVGQGLGAVSDDIRLQIERAKVRKLQPGFIQSFFIGALKLFQGRITPRETGRFEIGRVPAIFRSVTQRERIGAIINEKYERVTFQKENIDGHNRTRADLIGPGHPLLRSLVDVVDTQFSESLSKGALLVDPLDMGLEPRLLLYLEHAISDGREDNQIRSVVSRQFQFVEISQSGTINDAGSQPYLNYSSLTEEEQETLLGEIDTSWADQFTEDISTNWAIEHLAQPHFKEVELITSARVARVRGAIQQRLASEIDYWLVMAEETKDRELQGRSQTPSSGTCRQRAEDLQERLDTRLLELSKEDDLQNQPPVVTSAAIVIPQGLLDHLQGRAPVDHDQELKAETDRRAVAAVMKAERELGRNPEEQDHNNPGFDVLSIDPESGKHFFIEVKGYLPRTTEIKISSTQVTMGLNNPDCFRLVAVAVPDDPEEEPLPHYFVEPFDAPLNFAQTYLPLKVEQLLALREDPV